MSCGCKERREKMAKAFKAAANRLRTLRSVPYTAANVHNLDSRKKSVGLGG